MPETTSSSPLAFRPNPIATTIHTGSNPAAAMSNPESTTTAPVSGAGNEPAAPPSPTRARRPSTAEVLAASFDLEVALSPTTEDSENPFSTTSHHHHQTDEAGAERARTATEAWKPAINRRQSWNKEEHKRSLQMSSIADVKTGPGFSERAQ